MQYELADTAGAQRLHGVSLRVSRYGAVRGAQFESLACQGQQASRYVAARYAMNS